MQRLFTARNLLIALGVLFFGSILWSMLFETVLPLARAERWTALIANLFGLPMVLLGTLLMLWGFWVFLRDFVRLSSSSDWQRLQARRSERRLSREERRAAQSESQRIGLAMMKPGLITLVGGLLLIAAGGYIGTLG